MRAMMSVVPPGAKGTTSRIGVDGKLGSARTGQPTVANERPNTVERRCALNLFDGVTWFPSE
jgi:hypothetical protein